MFYPFYRQCSADQYPYAVEPGDTLNSIGQRLKVSVSRIIAANSGLDPYNLQVGQILCIPACLPNHTPKIIEQGDTLYQISQLYKVSVARILEANPGVDPRYLRVGQRICIPVISEPGQPGYQETLQAMQADINMLKAESTVQQTEQSNYGNSTATALVVKVTGRELQFDAAPAIFPGNYTGHFTTGKRYPYYSDAAMGGQRGITVMDNFGVWHSFGYHVPIS